MPCPARLQDADWWRDILRLGAGQFQEVAMDIELRQFEAGQAGLLRAEHVAAAAQAQILFGDEEAIVAFAQNLDPRFGGFSSGGLYSRRQVDCARPRPTRPRN